MCLPPYHQPTDRDALFALIDAHPLGSWVCQGEDGLTANHITFVLDRHQGPGTLLGHVARGNAEWRELQAHTPSVVTFQGPQAYITPAWYPGKAEHGRVVPTWNDAMDHDTQDGCLLAPPCVPSRYKSGIRPPTSTDLACTSPPTSKNTAPANCSA